MNLTTSWMQSDGMKALGWTFVHSLWQIALIGLLLFIVLRHIPGRSAHTRYTISTLALWLIVIMSLSTFIIMLPDTSVITEVTGNLILVNSNKTPGITAAISNWLEIRMPMMLTIWLGGVTILMLRLVMSLGWVRHMRSTSIPAQELQLVLDQIIHRLKLRKSAVVSGSDLISSPLTIGHLKPLILFPIGIINQLTPGEVEAILTHELAHIVRRDYLSNLIQSFIETLFYYHPITWWISNMVRTERENRADDLAVLWCGDTLSYAKTLLKVQEMQAKSIPSLSIGFASRKGAMLARIQRILNLPYKNHNQMEKTVLLSLCSLCFLAFTLTSHTTIDRQPELAKVTDTLFSNSMEKTDSIPATGTYRIHKKTDDQDISIEVENGDIKELKIDGKQIEPAEFDAYDEVIEDLFGGIEAPPSMEGFEYRMPPMPPIPAMPQMIEGFEFRMPDMPYMPQRIEGFEFPMPAIPPIPPVEYERLMENFNLKGLDELSDVAIWNSDGIENIRVYTDSSADGNTKIIYINGGDSSIICAPRFSWSGQMPALHGLEGMMLSEEDWKMHEEEWREQADQWRGQQDQWRDQWRKQAHEWRAQQGQLREEYRGQMRSNDDYNRAMEDEQRAVAEIARQYEFRAPRLSLSDEMVREGLVEPGDEVEVQLTPDKLKINGEKMPEAIHQKYLRMYEQQQGVELSGNSRVEFTTKSKQRM